MHHCSCHHQQLSVSSYPQRYTHTLTRNDSHIQLFISPYLLKPLLFSALKGKLVLIPKCSWLNNTSRHQSTLEKVHFCDFFSTIPSTSPLQIDLFLWRRIVRRKESGSIHHSVCPRPCAINNTLLVAYERACRSPVQLQVISTNKSNGTAQLLSDNSRGSPHPRVCLLLRVAWDGVPRHI